MVVLNKTAKNFNTLNSSKVCLQVSYRRFLKCSRNNNGPRTEVLLREKLGDNIPLSDLDRVVKEHDLSSLHEKEAYNKDNDKQKRIKIFGKLTAFLSTKQKKWSR